MAPYRLLATMTQTYGAFKEGKNGKFFLSVFVLKVSSE